MIDNRVAVDIAIENLKIFMAVMSRQTMYRIKTFH